MGWGALLLVPWRVVRLPVKLFTFLSGGSRRVHRLAVAGLDESRAQPILYTLRKAARTPEVRLPQAFSADRHHRPSSWQPSRRPANCLAVPAACRSKQSRMTGYPRWRLASWPAHGCWLN